MAHTLQERYSALVLAKLRKELILKDGIIFKKEAAKSRSSLQKKTALMIAVIAALMITKAAF